MGRLDQYLQLTNKQTEPAGTVTPMVDSSNAMASLADLMGPTPAEREAAERRMQKNRAQMAAWTGLFDGLRQLGNLYYATKGATPQQLSNPYTQVEQNYQEQRQLYNDMANYRRQYAQGLYSLRRQMDADLRAKEAHQSQMDYTRAREEALREDSKRKDEYNEARTKYYDAIANKNDEQAEYWRLRAQGVPKESAAKIAKDYAAAAKANRTGGGSGGRGNKDNSYVKERWTDENGHTWEKRVDGRGNETTKEVTPQQPKRPVKKSGSNSKATNNSGFFNN